MLICNKDLALEVSTSLQQAIKILLANNSKLAAIHLTKRSLNLPLKESVVIVEHIHSETSEFVPVPVYFMVDYKFHEVRPLTTQDIMAVTTLWTNGLSLYAIADLYFTKQNGLCALQYIKHALGL